jgi:hypothetical protein
MLCETIPVSQAELNSATNVVKDIEELSFDSGIVRTTGTIYYYPKSISVSNESGATIHFLPVTKLDYRAFQNDPACTNLIPVADSGSKEIADPKGHIEHIICSGLTGHSSGIDFIVTKEN